jgi:hypothetical protein
MQHGITVPPNVRQSVLPPSSGDQPSRFGVLFEREPEQADDLILGLLGRSGGPMQDAGLTGQNNDRDATVPAGFTFLGQFIDHELTLMSMPPALGQPQDLISVVNLRTPRIDLDTVFGKGPADPDSVKFYDPATLKLRLSDNGRDIVRVGPRQTEKLIPDPRNDQTVILVQLHVLFMKLYNHLLDQIPGDSADIGRYEQARRQTVLHFQNVILNDYLHRVVGQEAVDAAIERKASRYAAMVARFPSKLVMPVEFAFAAFRFGHSQLRDVYGLNADNRVRVLFSFDGNPNKDENGVQEDLNGNQPITEKLFIDWDFFFEVSEEGGNPKRPGRNLSRKFDTFLSPSLLRLRPPAIPNLPVSLAERNLRRGRAFMLPCGQTIARQLGISVVADLSIPEEVVMTQKALKIENLDIVDINERTPLWYYMLREAEIAGGNQLVGVGAWIVAETFIGLLMNDPDSILNNAFTPQEGLGTMAGIAKLFNS